MHIYNADGSEAMMCGNASRCIGKYLYEKGFTKNTRIKLETLSHFLNMLLVDTFRIKGFVYLEDTWYLVNAVGNMLYIEPCSEKKETQKNILVILSGYGLPTKKAIRKAMEWYPEVVLKIE